MASPEDDDCCDVVIIVEDGETVVYDVDYDVIECLDEDFILLEDCGTQGPPGPPGSSSTLTDIVIAGETIGGHRCVTLGPDGLAYYADNQASAVANGALWISTHAALIGEPLQVCTYGPITEPSWTWTPNLPVYLALNGFLTQTAPVSPARFLAQIGMAQSPTTLHVTRFQSIVLVS